MMASRRGSSCCALCEGSNLHSCCAACVNTRLSEYHTRLRMMRNLRDSLQTRIAARLEAKRKAEEQRSWKMSKAHDIKELRDRLSELTRRTAIEKKKVQQASIGNKTKMDSLSLGIITLKTNQADSLTMHTNAMKAAQMGLMATTSERLKRQSKAIKQLCRLFPMRRAIIDGEKKDGHSDPYDAICGIRLPRGLDPHSVPSEELSASLGYMLQVLSIAIPILSAPALHVAGFGASCSRIWQRGSYWSTRQSQSKVYPLFVPRQNNCSVGEENSWTESGSGNFGVDSDKKSFLDSKRSNSFNFSAASSHSMDQVSEANPDIGSQIKCVLISHEDISTNVKGDMNADKSDLELETKRDMVKPPCSIPSVGDDLQALDNEKELSKKGTPLQEIKSTTNMNLDKKEYNPDGISSEKRHLERTSGNESIEEDVMDSKHVIPNIRSDDLGRETEVSSDHEVKEVMLFDTVDSSVQTKDNVAKEKTVTPSEKRKPEDQVVAVEPIKRQCRLDNVKLPKGTNIQK